ncbi:MAG: lipopolysaccharide assembly protein LapB [Gammaproteobacteria bacterium]|nr:lipopolysaccharide assembly protein LapB [Gammaproteobacteria bacterium]
MPQGLLWLLLPVAAASGWFAAHRFQIRGRTAGFRIEPEYFKGLNYLLNEQPDKAIEVLVQLVEIDSETVEPHFALGNLFRRQGEVDRAIRIHQNLVARPQLTRAQCNRALFELGRDYYQAGLLDRAENLFRELVERDPRNSEALRLLGAIYEQENEWEKAIAVVSALDGNRPVLANYYCELAARALAAGEYARARKMLRRAYFKDRRCVRASLLAASLAHSEGRYKAAIKSLQRVSRQDPYYLSEAVAPLLECYDRIGRPDQAIDFLAGALHRQGAFQPVMLFIQYLEQHRGKDEARLYLDTYLHAHPSLPGLAYLLESLGQDTDATHRTDPGTGVQIVHKLLEKIPMYHCSNCGFKGNTLHWQCPGCRQWNTIKPYSGQTA